MFAHFFLFTDKVSSILNVCVCVCVWVLDLNGNESWDWRMEMLQNANEQLRGGKKAIRELELISDSMLIKSQGRHRAHLHSQPSPLFHDAIFYWNSLACCIVFWLAPGSASFLRGGWVADWRVKWRRGRKRRRHWTSCSRRRWRCGGAALARRPGGPSSSGPASSSACTPGRTAPLHRTSSIISPSITISFHSIPFNFIQFHSISFNFIQFHFICICCYCCCCGWWDFWACWRK